MMEQADWKKDEENKNPLLQSRLPLLSLISLINNILLDPRFMSFW